MSILRLGRFLVFLSIVTACTTDLRAQYARQAKLVANDTANVPDPNCTCPGIPVAQGYWVALSADGNTAIVYGYGDDNSVGGAAWIFVRSNGTWSQQGPKLTGTGAIGQSLRTVGSVAVSADGNTAVVGRAGDNSLFGALWAFTRTSGVWSQEGNKLVGDGSIGPYEGQGAAVTLSADGNTAVIDGRGDDKSGSPSGCRMDPGTAQRIGTIRRASAGVWKWVSAELAL